MARKPEQIAETRKICVVTGSRADYGLLYWPLRLLQQHPAFELQVVVTGMHLSSEHDDTWQLIEQDGFSIDARVEMLVPGKDSASDVVQAMALGLAGFAQVFPQLDPDLVVVLGDRFEIFSVATAASVQGYPIAHLCGGDLTSGAMDDMLRHAISKMAHLHFPSNQPAADRLIQMGEEPERIHTIGSTGLDQIRHMTFLSKDVFFERLGLNPGKRNFAVTFHPATLEREDPLDQAESLLSALKSQGPEVGMILTGSNADTGGQAISRRFADFAADHDNAVFHTNLGQELYLNLLHHADLMIGNSSSGLYEAPSFGIPTINIGSRQGGRLRGDSVIDCPPDQASIETAIDEALQRDFNGLVNPYGDGRSAGRFVECLLAYENYSDLLVKAFYEGAGHG